MDQEFCQPQLKTKPAGLCPIIVSKLSQGRPAGSGKCPGGSRRVQEEGSGKGTGRVWEGPGKVWEVSRKGWSRKGPVVSENPFNSLGFRTRPSN